MTRPTTTELQAHICVLRADVDKLMRELAQLQAAPRKEVVKAPRTEKSIPQDAVPFEDYEKASAACKSLSISTRRSHQMARNPTGTGWLVF